MQKEKNQPLLTPLPIAQQKKLSSKIFQEPAINLAKKTSQLIPKPMLWKGFSLHAIDGSTVTLDDTDANQEKFPQHSNQKEGVGFPIIRMVILQCLTTGMIECANYGSFKGKETGEMALARPLINELTHGDLLLGDRYFPSFFTMIQLEKNGIEGIFQMHGARDYDFRLGEKLGDLDHIVYWYKPNKPSWMSQDEYDSYPDKIKVRELDVTTETNSEERIILVTTLHNSSKHTKKELSDLYSIAIFNEFSA